MPRRQQFYSRDSWRLVTRRALKLSWALMKAFPFFVVSNRNDLSFASVLREFDFKSPVSTRNSRYAWSCLKLRLHLYIMCVFLAPPSFAACKMFAIMSILLRWSKVTLLIIWTMRCTRSGGFSLAGISHSYIYIFKTLIQKIDNKHQSFPPLLLC